ncbi:MAG: methionyl-tRNA formyltransferase [Myxococcota bacterium]
MRILYLGLPLGALHLARRGHVLAAVAVGHPESPGMRRLRRRIAPRGVPVLGRPDLNDPQVRHCLRTAAPDAVLSFFWPRKVPEAVRTMGRLGAFGVHPSLLPRWRGPDPYFWALRAGDAVTGVTLHRLASEYDTGELVARRRLPIAPDDDAWRLARRLDRPALELLAECADRLAAGEHLPGEPQDEAAATDAPEPTERDLAIDWTRSAEDIVRLVRAAAPWPGARARFDEAVVTVLRAEVLPEPPPRALRPGEAWRTPHGLAVCTGRGAVVVHRVRTDGGEERSGADLLPAHPVPGAGPPQAG